MSKSSAEIVRTVKWMHTRVSLFLFHKNEAYLEYCRSRGSIDRHSEEDGRRLEAAPAEGSVAQGSVIQVPVLSIYSLMSVWGPLAFPEEQSHASLPAENDP